MKNLTSSFFTLESGRKKTPVHLIELIGEGVTQRIAVFRKDLTFFGNIFSSGLAAIGSYSNSSDLSADSLGLTVKSTPQFYNYVISSQTPKIQIKIWRTFYEDLSSYYLFFDGRARGISATSQSYGLSAVSSASYLDNPFLRISTRVSCNHILYGPGCGLRKSGSFGGSNFSFTSTVSSVALSSRTIDITSLSGTYANGYFTGGTLEYDSSGYIHKTHIFTHDSDTLYLLSNLPVEVGSTVTLRTSCRYSYSLCETKMDNLSRTLSFPLIPVKNPTIDGN